MNPEDSVDSRPPDNSQLQSENCDPVNSAIKRLLFLGSIATVLLGIAPPAKADPAFTLNDGIAQVVVGPYTQAGMSSFLVDGVQHASQRWFWCRVGNNPEIPISFLSLISVVQSDSDSSGQMDTLKLKYTGSGFTIEVSYRLVGGAPGGPSGPGSQSAILSENIRITNTGAGELDFHFFSYSDLNLNASPNDDSGERINANTLRQTDLAGSIENVWTPAPNHFEISPAFGTRTKLNDGVPTI